MKTLCFEITALGFFIHVLSRFVFLDFLLVGLVLAYYTSVTLDIRTGMQSYKELTLYTILFCLFIISK